MAYPNTTVIWDDQSKRAGVVATNSLDGKPIIMAVSSADKGPEEFRMFDGDYIDYYGEISFARHGQIQAQSYRVLTAGGGLYYKRIVAPDSTLSNLSVVASVSKDSQQKVDASGAKIYVTAAGEETTAAEGNTPVMINRAKIKYDVMSITDLATLISVGNNPKEIARLTKEQIDVENEEAANTAERVAGDDLSAMGNAGVKYNTGVLTVTDKTGLGIANVFMKTAAVGATTVSGFGEADAIDITDEAVAGTRAMDAGDYDILVRFADSNQYPDELYHIVVGADDTEATAATVVCKANLKALITACQQVEKGDYTDASWKAFQIALTSAVLSLADDKDQVSASNSRVELQYAKDSLITTAEEAAIPKKFLLWTITDNGRGDTGKRVYFTPNYQASKNSTYTKYMMYVIEGTQSTDSTLMFSINPDIIDGGENRRIDTVLKAHSKQVRACVYENELFKFFDAVAIAADQDVAAVKENDILFGYTRKGKDLDWVIVDENSAALNSAYGLALQGGSNGSFGNAPMDSSAYYEEMEKAFDGTYCVDVFDLDNTRINAIFDAGFPIEVKNKIEFLVNFREDCFFFRDLGIGLQDANDILAANELTLESRYCASYHNSYDVYDEWTKKQITVTCMYDLAPAFVTHCKLGVNRPFAGILHGLTFPDVIEGTVNYIPKKIPGYDQPQELYDANINYMKYYDGILTLDTEKTSQDYDSELSYINNVLAIQEIIRIVRRRCPKIRYTFTTGDDFVKYQKDINQILETKNGFFDSIELVYLEDMAVTDPKCYFAAIKVDCKDFVESEYFKVTVI